MAIGDAYVFPGFLTLLLTQLFFPKPPTTFLTCFCRGERWKYAGKESRLNQGSNSQQPGHEYDTLTTEPPGRGLFHVYWRVNTNGLSQMLTLRSIPSVFSLLSLRLWGICVMKVKKYSINTRAVRECDLTLWQTTNFRLFRTESLQTTISNLTKNGRKLSKQVENTVGKGEIARYEQFLLFPQYF